MSTSPEETYVSRGGIKLAAALDAFGIDPTEWVCADLGSNVGGFVDGLLQRGAAKVYAIDTGYGTLAWKLRKDPRVVVMERTNAMHVSLDEAVDLVTIDVAWTPQHRILPNAVTLLKPAGAIVTLIKPHYEADKGQLVKGVLKAEAVEQTLHATLNRIRGLSLEVVATIGSPIVGQKGNVEFLAHLQPVQPRPRGERVRQ